MNKLLFLAGSVLLCLSLGAQDANNRASTFFGIGHNEFMSGKIDGADVDGDGFYSFTNEGFAFRWSLDYYLNSSLNVSFGLSAGSITQKPKLTNQHLQDLDLTLQYKLANGYILPEDARFFPYIFAGVGVFGSGDNDVMVPVGLGLRYRIVPGMHFQVSSAYKLNATEENKINEFSYLHHSLGLLFNLGGGKAPTPKDTDGDGIVDKEDECPTEVGTPATKGCPIVDADNDGIKDSEDACPQVAGLEKFQGCPDSDNDGIKDSEDACPQVAGLEKFQGCPDSDNDGIKDSEDACPQVAGLEKFQGCPDSDNDGVKDSEDACPQVAGSVNLKGCPDRDNDGIADKDDQCPDVAGIAALNGCSESKLEEELSLEAKLIQFETGSAVIKTESYRELDKILELMNAYPSSNFSIEGYTDDRGRAESNRALSQKRADAVKTYFVNKGISSARLTATGYGEASPVATNATAAGRKQNRRVEIHLKK